MLTCNVALRQCVRAVSPRAIPIPSTRQFLPPAAPCLVQQRTRSWFSRLLGTGFNSVKKSKGKTSRKTVKKKAASASKARSTTQVLHKTTAQSRTGIPSTEIEGPDEQRSPSSTPPTNTSVSQDHHDLRSFRQWGTKNGVNKTSTTYIGTEYEYTVLKALGKWYGMTLQRCGGPNDEGIDLVGDWKPPGNLPNFKVLVQCKFGTLSSAFARELEGACSGGREDWRRDDVLAVLASPKERTPGLWRTMQRSSRPMCFARISPHGRVVDFFPNETAQNAGLGSLERHTVYVPSKATDGKNDRSGRGTALSAKGRKSAFKFKLPKPDGSQVFLIAWLSCFAMFVIHLERKRSEKSREDKPAFLAGEEETGEQYHGMYWVSKK